MLSFTTDPYHPGDNLPTRETLQVLQDRQMVKGICTLTKGGSRALRDLDLFRPERDAFASTLSASLSAEFSRKWEREAAEPDDRIRQALRRFHDAGILLRGSVWSQRLTLNRACRLSARLMRSSTSTKLVG